MTDLTISGGADVRRALSDASLVTPVAPVSLGRGSTAALRDAMARFRDGDAHASPRAGVEQAISRISPDVLNATATDRTREHLTEAFDVRHLAFIVPTETLALGLGLAEADLGSTVDDVGLVVRSIGRGEPATPETDAATDRLTSRLADHPDGAVAAISLLYQVFDSTAALLSVSLIAERTAQPRRNALAKTVRHAFADTTIGEHHIPAGRTVVVSLEAEDVEFGAGPHRCPGEALARAIVDGMLHGLADAELLIDDVQLSADGRPATLPMRHR